MRSRSRSRRSDLLKVPINPPYCGKKRHVRHCHEYIWHYGKPSKTLAIKFILLSKTISGQQHFGIQYWGECWGGEDADETYNMYGSDPLGCYDNLVGMEWHNMVYKFESKYKKNPENRTALM